MERINSCDEESISLIAKNQEIAQQLRPYGLMIPGQVSVRSVWSALEYPLNSNMLEDTDDSILEFSYRTRNQGRTTLIRVKKALELLQSVVSPDDPKPFLTNLGYLDKERTALVRKTQGRSFDWRYPVIDALRETDIEQLADDIGDINADLLTGIFGEIHFEIPVNPQKSSNKGRPFVFAAYPIED